MGCSVSTLISQIARLPCGDQKPLLMNKNCLLYGDLLGVGGFGSVHSALMIKSREWFAVKEMKKSTILKHKTGISMLFGELEALKRACDHPFIVKLHHAFQDQDCCYLVIDIKTGGDLRQLLRCKHVFTERNVVFYVACIGSALSYMHQRGVIHRDIKPENIILDAYGWPHVTDFGVGYVHPTPMVTTVEGSATGTETSAVNGDLDNVQCKTSNSRRVSLKSVAPQLAKRYEEKKSAKQRPFECSLASGTRQYLSPEVFCRDHLHDKSLDYWSLGIMMYELLFSERPFEKHCPVSFIIFLQERIDKEAALVAEMKEKREKAAALAVASRTYRSVRFTDTSYLVQSNSCEIRRSMGASEGAMYEETDIQIQLSSKSADQPVNVFDNMLGQYNKEKGVKDGTNGDDGDNVAEEACYGNGNGSSPTPTNDDGEELTEELHFMTSARSPPSPKQQALQFGNRKRKDELEEVCRGKLKDGTGKLVDNKNPLEMDIVNYDAEIAVHHLALPQLSHRDLSVMAQKSETICSKKGKDEDGNSLEIVIDSGTRFSRCCADKMSSVGKPPVSPASPPVTPPPASFQDIQMQTNSHTIHCGKFFPITSNSAAARQTALSPTRPEYSPLRVEKSTDFKVGGPEGHSGGKKVRGIAVRDFPECGGLSPKVSRASGGQDTEDKRIKILNNYYPFEKSGDHFQPVTAFFMPNKGSPSSPRQSPKAASPGLTESPEPISQSCSPRKKCIPKSFKVPIPHRDATFNVVSPECVLLLQGLLEVKPECRLGGEDYLALHNHACFRYHRWDMDKVCSKDSSVVPPTLPDFSPPKGKKSTVKDCKNTEQICQEQQVGNALAQALSQKMKTLRNSSPPSDGIPPAEPRIPRTQQPLFDGFEYCNII